MKPPKALTVGERKAWRAGYLAALGDVEKHAFDRRVRIATRSVDLEAPKVWPIGDRWPLKVVKAAING